MLSLETLLTWSQLAIVTPLAVLGLHRGWLVALYLRHRRADPAPPTPDRGDLPTVTVQVPIYNERHVAARLIEAVAALDYPRDRLELQVLDDSTDDTSQLVAACLAGLPADLHTTHLRRDHRDQFKAGALSDGLAAARGELVAIFDADFVPRADFLRAVVPHFADATVGMVQTRWEHLNADYSLLTRMQALLLDGHFAVEHVARARSGCFFNFNGTAGVLRKRCIEEAGGWQGDTLTEDMDLSYRAQLKGWRFLYRPDISCPAELPVDMGAFASQQHRWAKGSAQTARKLLGDIWRARVPWRVKFESSFHLLGNLAFVLVLALVVLTLPLQLLRSYHGTEVPPTLALVEGLPLLLATAGVLGYYGVSQLTLRRRRRASALLRIPLVIGLGAGLSINNSRGVASGLLGPTGEFCRTPKNNALDPDLRPPTAAYRPRANRVWIVEVVAGCWAIATSLLSVSLGLPLTAIFHGLFGFGLLWVGGSSIPRPWVRAAVSPAAAKA